MEQLEEWTLWDWIGGGGGEVRGSVSSTGFSRLDLVTGMTK